MSVVIQPADVHRFTALIRDASGFDLNRSPPERLQALLEARLITTGEGSAPAYLARLNFDPCERDTVIGQLTVNESYFFRYRSHFEVLRGLLSSYRARNPEGPLRILSAGCASGEEPYSIAITASEVLEDDASHHRLEILGIDINSALVERARAAVYSPWALRETDPHVRDRYFNPIGTKYQLHPAIRRCVSFSQYKLTDPLPETWLKRFDVVFCRNVLMYLHPTAARTAMHHLTEAMVPGATLFLGHAETLQGRSESFDQRRAQGAVFYRLRPGELTDDAPPPIDPTDTSTPDFSTCTDPAGAAALIRQGRLRDALRLLEDGPPGGGMVSRLLMRARVLLLLGRVADAQKTATAIVDVEPTNADAYHMLALCADRCGNIDLALERDQVAAKLDRRFAMPHLHAGEVLRRRDAGRSRQELRLAADLLTQEREERVWLFGNGKCREALLSECQQALEAPPQPGQRRKTLPGTVTG